MSNEDIQAALLVILSLAILVMTIRALYGLFTWKGQRKKALIQFLGFPVGGFILMMIVAVAFPETSPERAAAIAEREAEREAESAALEVEQAAEAEARAQAEAEAEAAELEECRQDLRCWGERYSVASEIRCERPITRTAQYDMRWTDGWMETKFPRFRWENQDEGLITYIGDKAQFQNGFGAWQNVIYFCTYDPATDSAVSIEVEAGRLP